MYLLIQVSGINKTSLLAQARYTSWFAISVTQSTLWKTVFTQVPQSRNSAGLYKQNWTEKNCFKTDFRDEQHRMMIEAYAKAHTSHSHSDALRNRSLQYNPGQSDSQLCSQSLVYQQASSKYMHTTFCHYMSEIIINQKYYVSFVDAI